MPQAPHRHRKSFPIIALNIAIVLVLAGGTAAYGALSRTVTLTVDTGDVLALVGRRIGQERSRGAEVR